MVLETIEQTGERFGVITRVAHQLGIGTESLRAGSARPWSTVAVDQALHLSILAILAAQLG
jgi:hypothetical protein